MTISVFAIIALIIALLAMGAIELLLPTSIMKLPLRLLVILLAVIAIANRAGII